ncbi:gluconate 2-dehydrogenase subunit 3 family protein [Devosia sp.]|uniref:gluconate 2-dehydrogenase subunit 3 family protein n=1 Tax=Devosia sp. TaxID=1871048 RepID=UPI00263380D1|nr:gluconate 2-dehydrogenase subunit 3 family protein [Devosia sp.]
MGALGASVLPIAAASGAAEAQQAPTPEAQPAAPAPTAPPAPAPSSTAPSYTYLFFNTDEAAFIEAAVARLIPKDDQWGGALEAGVSNYIDKEMASGWGAGERLYRSGPWQAGTPSQGYQLAFTPAELFRTAMRAINAELSQTPFAKMSPADQDTYLKGLQAGGKDLGGVPSAEFFAELWEATIEGFFSDPVYGGNQDMLSWRMLGFPGAYASYYDLVDQHGIKFDRAPTSLAENIHGHITLDPGIPARSP